MRHKWCWLAGLAAIAAAIACSNGSKNPVTPSVVGSASGGASATDDTVTLKATAPTPTSPINGEEVTVQRPSLVVAAATGKYATATFSYRFQVVDEAGALVYDSGALAAGVLSYTVPENLPNDKLFRWRARAELSGSVGPWSAYATFRSQKQPEGYVRGSEVFDPLTNGKTVGQAFGVTFIPGKGVRLDTRTSYVEYRIATLTDGEFSLEAEGIANSSEEWKTKIMSMLEEGTNTTDNPYRVTIDKRSEWENQGSRVRYTMRSRGVDAGEPKGGPQIWNPKQTYGWLFEWRNGMSRLRVFDGGFKSNPPVKEDLGVAYKAPYAPVVHLVRLGSVGGRNEPETLPNVIIRNVWISAAPRPAWANEVPQ